MKKQRKYLFIATIFSLLLACEKDVDNTVPGTPQEKIEAHQQDFNHIFTSNNTENGKIWISDAQNYTNLYNYALRKSKQSFPFFVAFNPKKNNDINIYLTMLHNVIQDSPKDESGLLSNPNHYQIGGTFKLSFSISRQSILSSLRQKEIFDFDFDVYEYNQDFIHLRAMYQINNKDIIFRSYDFNDNVKTFFKSCQNLFNNGNYNRHGYYDSIYSSWFFSEITFKVEDSKKSALFPPVDEPAKSNFMATFSNMIEPYYNKEEKVFAFKIRKEFQKEPIPQVLSLSFLLVPKIKHLIPVSANDTVMVFSGVGKKLDDQLRATSEDETYTIMFKKNN